MKNKIINGPSVKFLVLIAIFFGIYTYGQTAIRKPLPEDRLPIPDYYGLYAVTDKGLVELKLNSVNINVGSDVEFIYYAKNASAAESLELYKTPSQNARQSKPKDDGKYKGLGDFMQQGENNYMANRAALEGLPQGSTLVEIRGKSITGKPEMVRLIPAALLLPGEYQVGVRSGPGSWYHFSISGSTSHSSINSSAFNESSGQAALNNNLIVAKGKGFEVKRSELDKVMIGAQANAAATGQPLPQDFGVGVLNQLITIQLLLTKATPNDRVVGLADAEKTYASLIKKFGSSEAYEKQLKAVGMTDSELRAKATQEAICKAALIRELNINATDKEAEAFYVSNKADFSGEPYVKWADDIKEVIKRRKIGKDAPAYVKKLRAEMNVEILDEELKAMNAKVEALAK